MSSDEMFVTVMAVLTGPVLWAAWLIQMSRVQVFHRKRRGVAAIASALAVCTALVFFVLKTGASSDVREAPPYLFMYVMLGLAWSRASAITFVFAGLSARDDVIERGNTAALTATIGGLIAVTLCYAGGNVGNGPGWWVVIFSAVLSTGTLIVTWVALTNVTAVADAVIIDRDPAAGLRLAAFLMSCGVVLGSAVAGDWYSVADTVRDFIAFLPIVIGILIAAVLVERFAQPTPDRPHAPLLALGVVPSLLYFIIAVVGVSSVGRPI